MLISKTAKVKFNGYMKKYYEEKGYFGKMGDIFEVKISDLQENSNAIVDVNCDFCKKDFTMKYCKYLSSKNTGNCCYDCRGEKVKQTNLLKYGVENTSQLQENKDKRKATCLEKYGRVSNLCLSETKDKIKKTNLERYNVEYVSQSENHKNKRKATNLERYGFENAMQNNDIKEKVRKSLYENNTCPTSKAQRHIHEILGGELNYPIGFYNVDILFSELGIYLEYAGSGHKLNVLRGDVTEKEFKNNELKRYHYLKRQKLKLIKFINLTDKLPSDDMIIGIFNNCVSYLSDNNEYFVVVNLDDLNK